MDPLTGESKTILPMADVLVVKEHYRYIFISPNNTSDLYSLSLWKVTLPLATERPEVSQTLGQSWNNLLKTYYVSDTVVSRNTD